MLIQITNRCHEGCPHCFQDSTPDGGLMTYQTFENAINFGLFLRTSLFLISGGEPTEHPLFEEFCYTLDERLKKQKIPMKFAITSNGTWFPKKGPIIKKITQLRTYGGMQVYTNPKWYKDSDFILRNRAKIEAFCGVKIDTTDILSMQGLGRAKMSPEAMLEVKNSKYHMSCLNGHLLFRQVSPTYRLEGILRPGTLCKPLVDYEGDVHLSESCLCPSFGNVNEDYMLTIFKNLQHAKPCYQCYLGQKFLKSTDPHILQALEILNSNHR